VRGVYARYAASGHILYVTSGGVLMAVPFDQDRMELTGTPVPLLEGISIRRGGGGVDLAISAAGALWYATGSSSEQLEVAWASSGGAFTPVDSSLKGDFAALALSPEGTRVALTITDATGQQIWVKKLGAQGGALSKLTFDGVNGAPRWSPDGKRVAFVAQFVLSGNLRVVLADGTSQAPTELLQASGRVFSGGWSPDGHWLVYDTFGASVGQDIWGIRPGVDSAPTPLLASKFAERVPTVSPDGRWLLYVSNATGTNEVYVRPFPNTSQGLYQISSGGGEAPKWSRDGREIFYQNPNTELVRARVGSGTTFAVADQKPLFSLRGVVGWDVGPDGRFIVIHDRQGRNVRRRLIVVENFLTDLKAKVPAGK